MTFPQEFKEMILSDIERIKDAGKLSTAQKLKLHRELDGRYQVCVNGWYKGLWGADCEGTKMFYNMIDDIDTSLQDNLDMMKAKLETYVFQMNAITPPISNAPQVNVTTNVNIQITFEQVRNKIEDMTSLTDEQTKEALDKVSEIESVVKGDGSKKSKWEKIKPILTWLADKSFDVAMTILPLLLQVQG